MAVVAATERAGGARGEAADLAGGGGYAARGGGEKRGERERGRGYLWRRTASEGVEERQGEAARGVRGGDGGHGGAAACGGRSPAREVGGARASGWAGPVGGKDFF